MPIATLLPNPDALAEEIHAKGIEPQDITAHPWLTYRPHDRGQRQFHEARHIIRLLSPGNGWGKSAALAVEVGYWVSHAHPFQPVPAWPVIVFLVIRKFDQWTKVRAEWEKWWPKGWQFNEQKKRYKWGNASQVILISDETDWSSEQGTNPDLVVIDETCPAQLWTELRMRRRGARKTRYCIGATQTEGLTWMYSELYAPWLEWHKRLGKDERGAALEQSHVFEGMEIPGIWVWPFGGVGDNPAASSEDVAFYASGRFASEAERSVRLGGGFRDFAGTPVFNQAQLADGQHDIRPGDLGNLTDAWTFDPKTEMWQCSPQSVEFRQGESLEGGRLMVWERPLPGHKYAVVFDAAYGIEGKDLDYVHVLNATTGEQAAVAEGRWSNATNPGLTRIVARLHYYYNGAFTGAERQVGLIHLRELWMHYGVTYQYRNRKEEELGRSRTNTLGHARTHNDIAMEYLRGDLAREKDFRKLKLHDAETLRQLRRYQFKSRRASLDVSAARDADLQMGAPEGDHDDAVTSLAVGELMLIEMPHFEPERPKWAIGTYGHLMQKEFDAMLGAEEEKEADPFAV